MCVIVDPELSPNVLDNRASIGVDYGAILTGQYVHPVKQKVVNIVHDASCAIVGN